MSLLRKAFATAAALVMVGTLTSTAHAEVETAWVNDKTRKCLSVQGANNVNGAPVYQYDCVSNPDQFWFIRAGAGNGVRFVNAKTRRCMAVRGADNRNGAPVFQHQCRDDYADQGWVLDDKYAVGGKYLYTLVRNWVTDKCLSIPSKGSGNGTQAILHECVDGWTDQRWIRYPH